MNRKVFLCLVLTALSNISARWVKNVTKDENKNLKSAIAHWKEKRIEEMRAAWSQDNRSNLSGSCPNLGQTWETF